MTKPTGNVTFLFTDIESNKILAGEINDNLKKDFKKHNSILSCSVESNNGFVFKINSEAFCCAFHNSDDAVKASLDIQHKLHNQIPENSVIKVKIGIHKGNAEWSGSDYMGYITLARTSRVMSAANGGQILISNDAYETTDINKFTNISFRDLGERTLKDLIKPMKLYQIVSTEFPSEFPPIKSVDARPNNLPIQLTSFIGREKEIATVKNLLLKTRLLTLMGSGGTGKTRLAIQIGADLIDEFKDGVWIAELAAVQDPTLLVQKIADSLYIKEQPGESVEESLISFLKEKEILILIDNCEHLTEDCAFLTEKLLKNSLKLKIIATSREALKCDGEITHKVLSLGHPDPNQKTTKEQLTQYEAVRLFIERALTVNIDFRITNENAPALAQICYQLDGIPLAIELAAVRIKILTLEKICEKLDNRFKILTGGKRTALPRQQTLKALIDWSYDLLSDKEKLFWNRLSVFSGGWTLQEAEEICTDDKLDISEILDLTNGLVEKSIISFLEESDKYKMLETIKQYGEERLEESNEKKIFLDKHLMHFLNLYESAEFNGPKAKYWLDKIENDYLNIQRAISWSIESNLREEGGRLALSLGLYWDLRGSFTEGRVWLDKIMSDDLTISPLITANLKRQIGILASQQGQNKIAAKYTEDCLEIFRSLNDKKGISNSLNVLGLINYDLGEYEKAKFYLNESLFLKKELGNLIGICSTLNSLGITYLICGEIDNAKIQLEEALELAKQADDDMYLSICYNNLAEVYANLDDYKKSKDYFELALQIDKKLGNRKGICVTLYNLGTMAYTLEDFENAKSIYKECFDLSKELDYKVIFMYSLTGLGQVAVKQGETQNAVNYFKDCLELTKDHFEFKSAVMCLAGISEVFSMTGKYELALKILSAAKYRCESIGSVIDKNFISTSDSLIGSIKNKINEVDSNEIIEASKSITLEEVIDLTLSGIKKENITL